jgi:hypothetical protein
MTVPPDRVRALYDTTVKPRLAALEDLRRQVRWCNIRLTALVIVPTVAALVGFARLFPMWRTGVALAGFAVFLLATFLAFHWYGSQAIVARNNYRARFKREVVAEIFRNSVSGASYEPFIGLDGQVFRDSGLFHDYDEYHSDDRVRGRTGRTPFETAEVKATYRGSGGTRIRLAFHGLFMQLTLVPAVAATTIIDSATQGTFQLGDRTALEPVCLGNPRFERLFKVYSTNEAEARSIVTATMMERLSDLRKQIGHPLFLCVKGSRVYIGVHYGRKLFEPGVIRPTSRGAVRQMVEQFALAKLIVLQLVLDRGTGSDAVDDSILRAGDARPSADQVEALTSGMLTEEHYDRLEDREIREMRAALDAEPRHDKDNC